MRNVQNRAIVIVSYSTIPISCFFGDLSKTFTFWFESILSFMLFIWSATFWFLLIHLYVLILSTYIYTYPDLFRIPSIEKVLFLLRFCAGINVDSRYRMHFDQYFFLKIDKFWKYIKNFSIRNLASQFYLDYLDYLKNKANCI